MTEPSGGGLDDRLIQEDKLHQRGGRGGNGMADGLGAILRGSPGDRIMLAIEERYDGTTGAEDGRSYENEVGSHPYTLGIRVGEKVQKCWQSSKDSKKRVCLSGGEGGERQIQENAHASLFEVSQTWDRPGLCCLSTRVVAEYIHHKRLLQKPHEDLQNAGEKANDRPDHRGIRKDESFSATYPKPLMKMMSKGDEICPSEEMEGYLVRSACMLDEGVILKSVRTLFLKTCLRDGGGRTKRNKKDLVVRIGEVAKPLGKIDLETRAESTACYPIDYPLTLSVPPSKGIATLVTRATIIAECRLREGKQILTEKQPEIHEAGQPDEGADLTEQILVNPSFPDQIVTIGGGLSPVCKNQLKTLLTNNMENPPLEPFCQKRRTFSPEKSEAVTNEAEEAFQQMKRLIISLPSLTPPFPKETLYAYLAVANEAVSAVLLTDRNGRQCPVQYVSRTLNDAEKNYSPLEKLALSLVNMTRRLRRYFEAHPVKVITDQPIKNILSRTEASGKLAKYAVEIGTYKISFLPRNAIKGQVLADFLSDAPDGEAEEEYFRMPEVPPEVDNTEVWTLFNRDGAASLTAQEQLSDLCYKDSMIAVCCAKAKELISEFKTFAIENIPREDNQKADILSKLATVPFSHLTKEILVEVLNEGSTDVKEVQTIMEEEGEN
ncbi:reverse transcriptase domain-containing protein [Tanacetum coccineum]